MVTTADTASDGRRARRERNRAAVIDAMISLLLEQGSMPPTDDVAARAGVSVSSVFRYFDNLEDLQHQTVATYFDRFGHLFEVPAVPDGTTADRVSALVDARAGLHSTVAPIARLVRTQSSRGSVIEGRLESTRRFLADQVRTHLEADLARFSPAVVDDLVLAIDALTSFEAWDLLHATHQRTDRQIRRAWSTAIEGMLAGADAR